MTDSSEISSYNAHTLRVLEYDRVREIVASLADSEEGRAELSMMSPSRDADAVRERLQEVGEVMRALRFDDPLPGLSLHAIRVLFPRLRVKGNTLAIEEIAAVADNLELAGDIRAYFVQKNESYPRIARFATDLSPHEDITAHIRKVITPEYEIADDASPKLLSIRNQLARTRNTLRKTVENILSKLPEEVVSERTVTLRDGRYVIPVRDGMKKHMPGAVHDRSQTGRTLFIEPLETIEGNNRVRELELAEQVEIIRICAELSDRIAAVLPDLERNQDVLVLIDTIVAKARYGARVDGVIPAIADESVLSIRSGRHPLLDWKYRKSGEGTMVIPLTLDISSRIRTMVITGPNAGGKTVVIKTVGLLTLMALSGMPIPANDLTSVFVPAGFFADIGDEQSIENDLSSFSSHMKQIVVMLREAGPGSLVLLDELGGATNPSDGEAIALAVLKKLNRSGAVTMATTHHDGLKVFAHDTEGAVNASMEFDNENLRPTFTLRVGIPGSSYAFEIAARMGMPEDVLDDAASLAGGEKKSLEGLISVLEERVKEADEELKNASAERMSLETVRRKYEAEMEHITTRKNEMLARALAESQEIVEGTNRRIESIIKSLREHHASRESILEAKAVIKETETGLREKSSQIIPKKPEKKTVPVVLLKEGMTVRVESIGSDAVVEEVLDGGEKARIRPFSAQASLIVGRGDLSVSTVKEKKPAQRVIINVQSPKLSSYEINVRGMTFEEACEELERFLDALPASGFETGHIIHGKGTGALRKKIGKFLDADPRVESWRLGNWNEGSSGVTVVTLKK